MLLDFSFTAAMIVSYIFLFFLIYMSVFKTYFVFYSLLLSVPVFLFFGFGFFPTLWYLWDLGSWAEDQA